MLGSSCVAERLAASQEGLGSMELFNLVSYAFNSTIYKINIIILCGLNITKWRKIKRSFSTVIQTLCSY
jgi:hypothetical protein